jgi:hypothetical protein
LNELSVLGRSGGVAADRGNPAVPNLLDKPFNTAIMYRKAVQEHGMPIHSVD